MYKEEEVGERPCASNFVVPGWKLNSKIIYRLAGMRLFPRAGNYDDDQKPHNSGCCKSESEKTIELSLFPAPVVFGQGGGGWLTTMCIKLCSSWMEIEFQDIIQIAWNEALPQGWKLHGVSQGPALDP